MTNEEPELWQHLMRCGEYYYLVLTNKYLREIKHTHVPLFKEPWGDDEE